MQTNNHDNGVRKSAWIILSIGIITCVFVGAGILLTLSSNIFPNAYRWGMGAMGAASVLDPAGQLCQSYGRPRLGIMLRVLGGIATIATLILFASFFIELAR